MSTNPVGIAEAMRTAAADVVALAMSRDGIDLDFSEASLEHVEHMLQKRRGEAVIDVNSLTAEQREELWNYCIAIGAYVGEVVVRNLGGVWETEPLESGGTSVKLVVDGRITLAPADSLWKVLTEPFKGVVSFYRSLRSFRLLLSRGDIDPKGAFIISQAPPLSTVPRRG